ncbi:helix-turn-helix domain-containing protein [Flavobacterium haoranii]|uniref:Helix-turn-helix domain-containing protein n=1 Tax=Flavobacterium haoranii TaxID=683124 RepID=A0A1M6I3U1_9FLAO|nr:helix-turn-helix domain-containing protein [Flavobacterium haoranii]MDK2772919.1 helix-turn-helix domain-containing protein [Flavobacterium sp.]SHJ29040.1 Helix-turn-helix domain-containing protein [Flavobacterium haoranii]
MKSEVSILKTEIEALKKSLLDLQQQAQQDIWYDGSDVKRLFHISESTLTRYRKEGKIPFTKLGGKYFYPKQYFTKSLMDKMQNKELL